MNTPILTIDDEADVEDRLTDNAQYNILPARYLMKDSKENVMESPAEMFERVAQNVAKAEEEYEGGLDATEAEALFEDAMKELRFMPNSPTLMNAGTDMNQLSACFVQEPQDDMENIFETAKAAALIFQSGGGCGYPFHLLRPKGHLINSTGGQASGPVSFMRVFDETCNQVKQGGKRRGAQMGILRVDHPDVGRFVVSKRNEGELDNFNISVAVTDEFIEAVENGDDYTLYDPTDDFETAYEVTEAVEHFYDPEYENNPASAFDTGEGEKVDENLWRDYSSGIEAVRAGEKVLLQEKWEDEISLSEGEPLTLPAEFIWDMMVDGAYQNGEPGIFHYDWTNYDHSFPESNDEYVIEATNPCAEQPLTEHEACNLGHINLSLMVDEDAETFDRFVSRNGWDHDFDGTDVDPDVRRQQIVSLYVEQNLDMESLMDTTQTATRFLEDVVEQSEFPLAEIEETVDDLRKIGVGVMGMAQMLYQMGVAYDSEVGRDISAEVLRMINHETALTSQELAFERGSFGAWEDSKWANPTAYLDWFERHTGGLKARDYPNGFPVRNHNQTTVAPTGTTSMLGDTSGGCEPVYSVAFYKNVGDDIQGDDFLVEFDSYFLKTLEANGIDVAEVKREAEAQMEADEFDGVSGLDAVPSEFGEVFVTTEQISPEDHTLMQRRLQEHVDSGISKTINLPGSATREDIDSAYRLALDANAAGKPAKGVTVYRDGSRDEQVKSTSADMSEAGVENGDELVDHLVDLYQSDAVGSEVVSILATRMIDADDIADEEVKLCPECRDETLQMQESCALCPNCGFSPCS